MSERAIVAQPINWRELFPFTHIFRTFRIAMHPSKLVLGLMALVALYVGGRILDGLWGRGYRAIPGEIEVYQQSADARALNAKIQSLRKAKVQEYAPLIVDWAMVFPPAERQNLPAGLADARKPAEAGQYTADVRYYLIKTEAASAAADAIRRRDKSVSIANNRRDDHKNTADVEFTGKEANPEAAARHKKAVADADDTLRADLQKADATYHAELDEAFREARGRLRTVDFIEGDGPFKAFFHYEAAQLGQVTGSVLNGNWLGDFHGQSGPAGVLKSLVNFVSVAPCWALQYHTVYFVIYGAWFLCVWSLFGGAIARIAAVQVADEGRKLSLRQGMEFSIHKFLSFLSAPLIPALIIVGIGLVIAVVCGALAAIPYVNVLGRIIIGAGLIVALLGGLVMTLVILGMSGGLNLMYPTIAVEGSDSFDAISRSFSYVYARPWRLTFYTLVGVGYGSLCYLFVRLVIWLVLLTTHFFVGILMFQESAELKPLWNAIWPTPAFNSFSSSGDSLVLGLSADATGAGLTAVLVHCWVYLVVAVLGAFAISFYFSMHTIIYYLLRKEVDATEMDDVFLEETEDDFADRPEAGAAPEPAPAPAPASEAATAAPTPNPATPATGEATEPNQPESPEAKT